MYHQMKQENRLVDKSNLYDVASKAIEEYDPSDYLINNLTKNELKEIANSFLHNKEVAESIQASRHNFYAISDRTGHDGIDSNGHYYEVKQNEYIKDKAFGLNLAFDRVSQNNLDKFKNDRPTILLFALHKGSLVYELEVEFSDALIAVYESALKNNKTTISFSFSTYRDSIKKIHFVSDNLSEFNGTNVLVEYIYETTGEDIGLSENYLKKKNFVDNITLIKSAYTRIQNYSEVGRLISKLIGLDYSGSYVKRNLANS